MKILFILILLISTCLSQQNEKKPADFYWRDGDLKMSQGKYSDAVKLFSEALNIEPENTNVLYKRAEANFLAKNLGSTERDLKKLISLDSNHAQAHFLLGRINLLQAKFQESIEFYELGLKINPNSKDANEKLKDAKSGLKLLNQAQDLINQGKDKEALPEIDQILSKYSRDSLQLRLKKVEIGLKLKNHNIVREEVK